MKKRYVFERVERTQYYAISEEDARELLASDYGSDKEDFVLANVEDT